MKVPCIASNVGAVSEVIEPGESGLLFEAGDIETLVRHIRLLLENDEQRVRLAEVGFGRVTTEFTSARMADKHREFYEKVLNSARGKPPGMC